MSEPVPVANETPDPRRPRFRAEVSGSELSAEDRAHSEQIDKTLAWLFGGFETDDPFQKHVVSRLNRVIATVCLLIVCTLVFVVMTGRDLDRQLELISRLNGTMIRVANVALDLATPQPKPATKEVVPGPAYYPSPVTTPATPGLPLPVTTPAVGGASIPPVGRAVGPGTPPPSGTP